MNHRVIARHHFVWPGQAPCKLWDGRRLEVGGEIGEQEWGRLVRVLNITRHHLALGFIKTTRWCPLKNVGNVFTIFIAEFSLYWLVKVIGMREDVVLNLPVFCRWSGVILSVRFSFNVTEDEMAGSSCSYWTLNETHLCLVFFSFLFVLSFVPFLSFCFVFCFSSLFVSQFLSFPLSARVCAWPNMFASLFLCLYLSSTSVFVALVREETRTPSSRETMKYWCLKATTNQRLAVFRVLCAKPMLSECACAWRSWFTISGLWGR